MLLASHARRSARGGEWHAGTSSVWRIVRVNYPIAEARGWHLPGSGGAFRSAVHARAQVPAHPYPVCIGRLADCTEWGSPARQRTRGTHYVPGLAAATSHCHQCWVRRSRLLRVMGTFYQKEGGGASSPCRKAGVSAPEI